MYYLFPFLVGLVLCDLEHSGWNYLNLHCRDNANSPVDWWILYKPPSGDGGLHFESGRNFTYITPNTSGKWQPSYKFITTNSMLQHTLSPLFRPTYQDHLASMVYQSREPTSSHPGSAAMGVMMADAMGGLWMGHTVAGLLDLTRDRIYFPENEIHNGHMMVCLSLNLDTLNMISNSLRMIEPEIVGLQVPQGLKLQLPEWLSIRKPYKNNDTKNHKKLEFLTQDRLLLGSMVIRSPGDRRCIYKSFAKDKKIVLDVYGHGRRNNLCEEGFSVRNLDAISLKYAENIYYINNQTDRACFAVSTAAHWQKLGDSKLQYWTCTSNLENEDRSGKGGLVLCLEDYHVWRSFDTLKIKEPEC